MLTMADDYPIHQMPEPIAYSGTDRNFYDRYWFNGFEPDGSLFFLIGMGIYPHLNVIDCSISILVDGKQHCLRGSRILEDRMDMSVGPMKIDVVKPLWTLRFIAEEKDGIAADLTITGRAFPIEEPRFMRRVGTRAFMDYTRLTQNGRYSGWIEVDGVRTAVDGFVGTRDRSWGVRPIGARDPQEPVPPVPPQFFWLWSPCNFADGSFFFHTNDDELGRPWNRRAVWLEDGGHEEAFGGFAQSSCAIRWKSGTRHVASASLDLGEGGSVSIEPQTEFFMLGLGYTHPTWGHGHNQGELKVEREDFVLADIDRRMPHHLHVQALSRVTYVDGQGRTRVGRGVFEQLAIGPHAPSGFASILDLAP
ncbi:MAG: hypothetical protein B7Z12_18060 [Caulobacter vibrioides]|uniref:Uncharacterized protein n=1 Tax=Caulobacter vibrioides TaxID=155892 RepID=A0A258CWJ6_CAUVI|nr:MAG: hypothetical protein B7Z12_18060 [Caulobacter vibrioides]